MTFFGVDIQSVVADAVQGQLRPAVLTRETQGGTLNIPEDRYEDGNGDPVAPGTATFNSEGLVEKYSDEMIAAGLATASQRRILLIAKPLGTTPKAGDNIEIDGETFTVVGIPDRDPAGATWIVKGER